jgi:NADH-quinone oxidoreductase subunit E
MEARKMEVNKVDEIVEQHGSERRNLIGVLHDTQTEYGYLPREAIQRIAQKLEVPLSQILRVASFYAAFSFKPRGRHLIGACLGTTCHVRGMGRIMDKIQEDLGIESGETTTDQRFTLETVRCLGCCSLAPVMRIDEKTYGRLRRDKVEGILNRFE